MKAVSASYDVPEAAVEAIRAGCDGVLICSGDVDLQGRTLEALVRAVESGRIPAKRHDDAFARLKRAKQRFLLGDRPGPGGAHQGAARRPRPRRASAGRRRDGGLSCDPRSARLKSGDRVALVAPASSFPPEEVAGRRRGAGAARSRGGLRRVALRQGSLRRRLGRDARARHSSTRGRIRRSPRLIAMRGGYGSAQLLPFLDPDVMRLGAQGADRLQRHHRAPVALPAQRADGDSRTDDRSAALEGAVGLRRGLVPPGDDVRPSRRASCRPAQLETLHHGTATGMLDRRHADAAHGVAGHAVGLRSAARLPCCSSRTSASGRIAFIGC